MALSGIQEFFPHRSVDGEARLRHIEDYLATLAGRGPTNAAVSQQGQGRNGTLPISQDGGNVVGRIPESQVIFDRYGGHHHDGTDSRLVPMAGDVTGDTEHSKVVQIEAIPIPAPLAGDDQKFIQYDNGTVAFRYTAAGSVALTVPQVTKTGNYTVTVADTAVWADATTGAVTITLLTAVGHAGKVVLVKKIDNVNNVILAAFGAETIDGATTVTIGIQNTTIWVVSNGINWYIV